LIDAPGTWAIYLSVEGPFPLKPAEWLAGVATGQTVKAACGQAAMLNYRFLGNP
jgi:hypothetical protein